jgi:CobW/HypB/UreG family nucleotide-binding protein
VQADPLLRQSFCLGNVITTVDAVNGMRQLDVQPESVKQVAVADRLVLTKTDLATVETVRLLVERLCCINRWRRSGAAPIRMSTQARCSRKTLSTASARSAGCCFRPLAPATCTATATATTTTSAPSRSAWIEHFFPGKELSKNQ